MGLEFTDSLSYLQMPLKKIPSALGLDQQVAKGDFPHLLANFDHQGKIWPRYPPISYYDPEGRSPKETAALKQWHASKLKSGARFIYDDELSSYVRKDVEVLARCLLQFRKIFMNITTDVCSPWGIDPFLGSFTIASACSRVFRCVTLHIIIHL